MGTGWKPKEKPLTLEEAVALAKKDLAPHWIGSPPLVATVKNGTKVTAYPLDPSFITGNWLLLFVDPLDFSGEDGLHLAHEWHRRFGEHHLGIIVIFQLPYARMRDTATFERILPRQALPFIAVLDHDLQLAAAFGARELPKVLLLSHGKPVFDHHGKDWHQGTESKIQSFLRQSDPGLPLLPVFDTSAVAIVGDKIDFAQPSLYPPKAFAPAAGRSVAKFHKQKMMTKAGESFWISGNWVLDGDRILTADKEASLEFTSPSRHVVLIAQAVAKELATVEIQLELEGKAAFEDVLGKDLSFDESGGSIIKVRDARAYQLLVNLPEGSRKVTLRFASESDVATALYGLRFAD